MPPSSSSCQTKIIAVSTFTEKAETCGFPPIIRYGADCHLGTPEAALVPPIYPIADPLSLVLSIPKPLKLHPLYLEPFPLDAANFCRCAEKWGQDDGCGSPQGMVKAGELARNVFSLEPYKICRDCGCWTCEPASLCDVPLAGVDQKAIARGLALIAAARR